MWGWVQVQAWVQVQVQVQESGQVQEPVMERELGRVPGKAPVTEPSWAAPPGRGMDRRRHRR